MGTDATPARSSKTPQPTENASTLFRAMSIADAAIKLFRLRDQPLRNPGITRELKAGGRIMNSADPVNTVGAVLLRRSQQVGDIVKTSSGEWALKAWTKYARAPKTKADNVEKEAMADAFDEETKAMGQ